MTEPFTPHHARATGEIGPLEEKIVGAIRTIFDPEIPINIYDLGLIYEIAVDEEKRVDVRMTLTSPNCPEAETIPGNVQEVVKSVEGVSDAEIELVWEPPFSVDMMSEAARLQLNL
jgi:FeS assembly SUF system protein